MGKIRSRVVRRQPSETPEVRYRLCWATCRAVNHNMGYSDVRTTTKVTLPDDIPSFPLVAGKFVLGVSAIRKSGNESEISSATFDLDFTIPGALRNLRVEDS